MYSSFSIWLISFSWSSSSLTLSKLNASRLLRWFMSHLVMSLLLTSCPSHRAFLVPSYFVFSESALCFLTVYLHSLLLIFSWVSFEHFHAIFPLDMTPSNYCSSLKIHTSLEMRLLSRSFLTYDHHPSWRTNCSNERNFRCKETQISVDRPRDKSPKSMFFSQSDFW